MFTYYFSLVYLYLLRGKISHFYSNIEIYEPLFFILPCKSVVLSVNNVNFAEKSVTVSEAGLTNRYFDDT
jgi:hypothetical protein